MWTRVRKILEYGLVLCLSAFDSTIPVPVWYLAAREVFSSNYRVSIIQFSIRVAGYQRSATFTPVASREREVPKNQDSPTRPFCRNSVGSNLYYGIRCLYV
ncbi:hypothetical protein B9Z19DRAFT_1087047 [Tuber borchii]|uniref:Uncharacterized protein n=1 Tax=Tuber borchii TaxID=42251 RepID=A0A2T6ZNP7_TUBBO|nr:hypothetical protein B9Z19DRAFT_1087047 [Tuber borchii]